MTAPPLVLHHIDPPHLDVHAARCTVGVCPFRRSESGHNAARNIERQAREHVAEKGHRVDVVVTMKHSYRPNPEAAAIAAATTSQSGHTGQRS